MSWSPRWWRSVSPGHTPLGDAMPWIPVRACAWLDRTLRRDMAVFEYGSGGSTLFFAARVSRLVSVEHDPRWHEQVAQEVARRRIPHVTLLLREPERRDEPDPQFVSALPEYAGCSFRGYVETIEEYPAGAFDMVMVDGRCRNACIRRAARLVKPGGHVLLDNAYRERYAPALASMTPHEPHVIRGLVMYMSDTKGQFNIWRVTRPV